MKRHPIIGIENGEEVLYLPTRFINYTKSAWDLYTVIAIECAKNKSYSTNLSNKELAGKPKLSVLSIMRALRDLGKEHFIKRNYSGHTRKIELLDY